MKRNIAKLLCLTALVFGAASAAQAQFVTSSAGINGPTTVINFSQFVSQSPILNTPDVNVSLQVGNLVGRDVRMTYMSGSGGLYGSFNGWGLPPSGNWTRSSIGINQTGVVRYAFMDGPVSGVGVLMNYAQGYTGRSVFVRSLDINFNVIDEVNLLSNGAIPAQPTNGGEFRGFQYGSASVYGFEVGESGGNSSPIMTDLTFTATTVAPEPSSVALMAAGLAALAFAARKRRKA